MAVVPDSFLHDVARRFAMPSDPTRLKIVSVLHEYGECTVGRIAEVSETSAANAPRYLQRPAVGGVVGRRRKDRTLLSHRRRHG